MTDEVAGLFERGMALCAAGRYADAVEIFAQLLRREPHHPDALNNRGVALAHLKRYPEAIESFEGALSLKQEWHEPLVNRGIALARLGRHEEALSSFEQALAGNPGHLAALSHSGASHFVLQRFERALECYERILRIKPDDAHALNDRGTALSKLKKFDAALASYEQAIRIKPDFSGAISNRGKVLSEAGRLPEALASFEAVLRLRPDDVDAWFNHGTMLDNLGRLDEALLSFERALAIDPGHVLSMGNYAAALMKLNRGEEALARIDRALMFRPDWAGAHCLESICRLQMGDYPLGLRKYEWRFLDLEHGPPRREFRQPLWIGQASLAGKTILLHAEQGLGDVLQMVRYVPLVAAKGASVVLEVPGGLVPLMRGLAGVSRLLGPGEPLPETDFQCPLPSLPLAFGTTVETIPSAVPYLSIPPRDSGLPRKRGEKRVGVCWRGNPGYKRDQVRSIGFAEFVGLMPAAPGIRFVSLQKEMSAEEQSLASGLPLEHPGTDFKSTAEIIAGLDLVISVDTVWAHWAGAIGKPLWVLLPFSPHWIWLLEREDSPWYPTARLFRQSKPGDWEGPLRAVRRALEQEAQRR